jgi:Fe-Mn family superoxide dismutase
VPSLQRRSLHHVPPLSQFNNEEGVPGLLSVSGFDIAWNQRMTMLLERLNARVAGTEYESKELKSIILSTARGSNPDDALTFNYASAAHNNHFFFKNLTPNPKPMPETLRHALSESFSSVETLREQFIVQAEAMFGPGFIWLVKVRGAAVGDSSPNSFRLLNTYLAGSPYAGAHWRRQEADRNTKPGTPESAGPLSGANYPFPRPGGKGEPVQKASAPGGIEVQPLLCLNTWEHVWLRDYGLGAGGEGGRAAFAANWWEVIDWETVAHEAAVTRPGYLS